MRITKRHREILVRINDGWNPFPFQLSGLEKALLANDLVKTTKDPVGNTVLSITDHGRAFLEMGDSSIGPEEDAANARLLGAAEDLLAACKLWDEGFVDGEQFTSEEFLAWVNRNRAAARAAIAKATGK